MTATATIGDAEIDVAARWLGRREFELLFKDSWVFDDPIKGPRIVAGLVEGFRVDLRKRRVEDEIQAKPTGRLAAIANGRHETRACVVVGPGFVEGYARTGRPMTFRWKAGDAEP